MKSKFLIGIGIEKCGTTSLNSLLNRTDGFITPPKKETFFFSQHFHKGSEFFRKQYKTGIHLIDAFGRKA